MNRLHIRLPDRNGKKRVVIIGGGFAGLKVARSLRSDLFQVVLLDQNNYHQFQPLLYQVATSGIEPSAISFPFRKIFQGASHSTFRMCSVEEVVPSEKQVRTDAGTIEYDYLVIATGCNTNYFGQEEHLKPTVLSLKSVSEALYVRNHILSNIEQAMSVDTDEERSRLMTFVIVGGGATGVELSGALAEMRSYVFPKDYPDLDLSLMRIMLIDGGKQLLAAFSEKSSNETYHHLLKLGVQVHLQTVVTDYTEEVVTLSNGEKIESSNLFWVGGIIGNPMEGLAESSWGQGRRLFVDEFNQLKEHESIFAIGDIALMATEKKPKGDPQVAQVAIQQGKLLARNLERQELGRRLTPFTYHDKGSMATIGRNAAVAEIAHLRFHGFPAWFLWCFVHLMAIVGVKNRLVIFINWMWNYITYDQSLRVLIKPMIRKI